MSEFQEVVKQWRRMCVWHSECEVVLHEGCAKACTLGHSPLCGDLESATDEQIACAEREIMQWAEEHPEPVYPTWRKYLTDIGVIPEIRILPTGRLDDTWGGVDELAFALSNTRIRADIARKLGIEQREE